jgi:hypothetical protein
MGILVCLATAGAFAGTVSLQDLALNDNGTFTDLASETALPLSSTLDALSGLGTLTYVYNPGVAGTYFMDVFFDYQVGAPLFNEYGAFSGVPVAGQTWQIDASFLDGNFVNPTLYTNVQNNTLDNTNHVHGPTDNFLLGCGANMVGAAVDSTCNTDVAMGMGFNYTLAANEKAVITLTASPTAPTEGFYLRQIHPADQGNDGPSSVYLSGNLLIQPSTGPGVPEPASWLLVGSAALIGLGAFRRKCTGK